ncbi:MAG: DUF4397 domain-containing protein [Mucilaginibacter sp.]|uniref:DUF4397 domain-containing protein n=1 Tax=Mucilaginibacter sp. TaxID=1882438 RepID=UPI003265B98D
MAACKPNSSDLPAAQPPTGLVAYFNLIPNGSAINFYINGSRQNANKIAYNEYSGYITVPSGEQSVLFKTDSLRNNLFDPVTATLATDYTTIFVTGNSATNLIYARDTAVIDASNYKPKLRFINASANSPGYDVVLKNVSINNTAYKGISKFARVDTGTIAVNIKLTGSSTSLITKTVNLGSNRVYTLFIYGTYSATGAGLNLGVIANK